MSAGSEVTLQACRYLTPERDFLHGGWVECGRPSTERVLHVTAAGAERTEAMCARHAAAACRRKWHGNTYRGEAS